jgi:hypothetical protein
MSRATEANAQDGFLQQLSAYRCGKSYNVGETFLHSLAPLCWTSCGKTVRLSISFHFFGKPHARGYVGVMYFVFMLGKGNYI